MKIGVAGDVAGPAAAGAQRPHRLDHCVDHGRVLAHTEIVVRAPHGHLFPDAMVVRSREAAAAPLEIGEDAIASLATKLTDALGEEILVVHLGHRICETSESASNPEKSTNR